MKQQHLIFIGLSAFVLLLLGGSIVAYGYSINAPMPWATPLLPTQTSLELPPKIELTSVPSLSEVAAEIRGQYPQLADLLENPELGSVYKDFYLVYQNGGAEAAIALARQRNIMNKDDQIIMTLVLDTDQPEALIKELEAEKVIVSGYYKNLINIAIPLSLIEEQVKAKNPGQLVEHLSNLNHVIRLELPKKATIQQSLIVGQGVNLTLASHWHAAGFSGQGIKIGILDLGFANYRDLLGNELPAEVTVETFGDTSDFDKEAHGTACAEIIHEMAPEATLYLAYYDGSDAAMGQAVEWLMEQGVSIISNSTNSIGTTPLNGTGFSADLVNQAYQQGIFWVNSAGNYAERHYRGQYQDSNGDNKHDFGDPDKQVMPFIAGTDNATRIVLSWNDWANVSQDYDLLLYREDGTLLAKSEEAQEGKEGQLPIEGFIYTFDEETTYLLSIENYGGEARGDAMFDLFIEPSLLPAKFINPEYSLGSPADADKAFAVGAVYWYGDTLETYSSHGPTTDGRLKPDLVGPASVDTSAYSPKDFPGTSAAAPHVAGAAALVLQAFPQFAPDDIAQFLKDRAVDLGDAGADDQFGAGRLNLGNSPTDPTISTDPPPATLIAQVRPTSTPRSPEDITFEEHKTPKKSTDDDGAAALLGGLVFVGLCLVCLSGLLFGLLMMIGLVLIFRR